MAEPTVDVLADWALVPRYASPDMVAAGRKPWSPVVDERRPAAMYHNMVAAAPEPPIALAAVAELVEADREYDAVKAEHDACAKYDEHGAYVPREMYERMEAVSARRAAALDRFVGAP